MLKVTTDEAPDPAVGLVVLVVVLSMVAAGAAVLVLRRARSERS